MNNASVPSRTEGLPTLAPPAQVGRPKGRKNKNTLFKQFIESPAFDYQCQALLKQHAKPVLQKMFEMAESGDPVCMKMVVDRLWPLDRSGGGETPGGGGINITINATDPKVGRTIEARASAIEGTISNE